MNNIADWNYEAPTEAGLHMACFGDIEVFHNLELVSIREDAGRGLVNQRGIPISEYSSSYKWAKLSFSADD